MYHLINCLTKEKIASARTLPTICKKELAIDLKAARKSGHPASTNVVDGNGENIDRQQLAAARREVYEISGSPSMCL
jgi:hypothetical protein